jgi:RNA-directed DNA polymerase
LQIQIANVYKSGGNHEIILLLQEKLVKSFAARALAVRKVTTNSGRNTPGVDNQV